MIKLKILDWGKLKQEVDFVGYNADHTVCYIYDENHAKHSLILTLPHEFGLQFRRNPIPQFPPIAINRAALELPTCFASKEEYALFRQRLANWPPSLKAAPVYELLKLANPRAAWIEPKQETKLVKMLVKEKLRLRKKYEERKRAIPKHPADQREVKLRALQKEFTTKVQGDSIGSSKIISVFKLKREDAKCGALGLRDKLLHQEFAEAHDFDLATIPDEARRFRRWITKNSVSVNHLSQEKWKALQMRVRYEIVFFDGTRCWLDKMKEAELTDLQQIDEFDRLEAATDVANEILPLNAVLWELASERKGKKVPMGLKGLEKLCEREEINFEKVKKRGMHRSQIDKLLKTRERQKRVRVAHLKKLHKGKINQKFTEASAPSPIEPDDHEQQPSVGASSLSKLEEKLQQIERGKRKS